MRGVFLDLDTMAPDDLSLSKLQDSLPDWQFFPTTPPEETAERIRGAQIVVVQKVVIDEYILNQADSLKMICVAATGTNNVDLQAAASRNIPVCNVQGYADGSVPQHVFAMALALVTRLFDYHMDVQKGKWPKSQNFCFLDYPIRELANMTLGLVGTGHLGSTVARIGEGFGMKVLLSERPGKGAQSGRIPFHDLLKQADIISLHCPLNEHTKDLIGEKELAMMKNDAILINTARGGIVNEQALADALRHGIIGAAGIDVVSTEPPVNGNPLLADDIPNLIVTPHVAWGSREARQCVIDQVALNIHGFLNGEPKNVVT